MPSFFNNNNNNNNNNPVSIQILAHRCCMQAVEEELKTSGALGEVYPVRCDLRRESDIMDMFQLIRGKYGRLDVCINNAGVVIKNTITEGSTEEWREMFDVSALQLQEGLLYIFLIRPLCAVFFCNNVPTCRYENYLSTI